MAREGWGVDESLNEANVSAALARLGHNAFRPGQRETIAALMDEGSVLLVAPTGGGKSLCYQLPALLLPGTTVVVSPLVALMHDQVNALQKRGISATYLASTLSADENKERFLAVVSGSMEILYVTPERLALPSFRNVLREIGCPLLAIDEAHCISEWGHDFRPEYLQIGEALQAMRCVKVLACTATATPFVRDEILSRLALPEGTRQIVQGFARPNLALAVAEASNRKHASALVDSVIHKQLGEPKSPRGSAIVYATTRREAEAEGKRLQELGFAADIYHAGLSPTARKRTSERFSNGKSSIVVATNAFGMGIDRSDVRAVIHLGPPGSIESYYQEVGRAGRDGAPAAGLLITQSSDLARRRGLLEMPDDQGDRPAPEVIEHKWSLFLELMRWAEGESCRHDAILRYFGDDDETLDGCGHCDVCCAPEQNATSQDDAVTIQKLLSGVARVSGRFGLKSAVALLRGEVDERLTRNGLDQTRTFGILSERSSTWVTSALQRCMTAGLVNISGERYPLVSLTEAGRDTMLGQRPARVRLPSAAATMPQPRASSDSAPRKKKTAANDDDLDATGLTLFEALRRHRRALASRDAVPPYVIASDRTLRDLARIRPKDLQDLRRAHGIGEAKASKYGDDWLQVVREVGV